MAIKKKKTIKKIDKTLLRTVKSRLMLQGKTIYQVTQELGINHSCAIHALTGFRQGKKSQKLKEKLIRLSKGLPIEETPGEHHDNHKIK